MKKVLSVVLALAMVLTLAVPAFATSTTDTSLTDIAKAATGASTDMQGKTEVPTLNIVVPKIAKIIVNPYQMQVDDPSSTNTPAGKTQATVISPNNFITNTSNIALEVGAKITGKAGTGVNFATAAPDESTTGNDVYLTFEAAPLADATAKTSLDWSNVATKEAKVVSKTAVDLDNKINLPATDGTNANYLAYHVTGSAAPNPTKPWLSTMTAGVTVAFTFKPVANTVSGGGGGGGAVTATIGNSVATNMNSSTASTATLTVSLSDNTKTINSVTWSITSGSSVTLGAATGTGDVQMPITYAGAGATTIKAVVTYDTTETAEATISVTCD